VEPVAMTEPVLVGGGAFANYQEEVVEATRARLHDIAPKDVELQEDIMVGKPYQQILERAAADHSDLIVIGVHSGIIERLGFFGSTTNHIVREASCPVLSLRG
jgi:nucleotide-binding universal stress UspA family protein